MEVNSLTFYTKLSKRMWRENEDHWLSIRYVITFILASLASVGCWYHLSSVEGWYSVALVLCLVFFAVASCYLKKITTHVVVALISLERRWQNGVSIETEEDILMLNDERFVFIVKLAVILAQSEYYLSQL